MDKDKLQGKLWRERKRNWCGLPWTFTVYSFDEERIFVERGFFTKREDECRMYRVMDLSVKRTLGQRIFGMGTIEVHSSDRTLRDFKIENIKNVHEVKEMISKNVELMRDKKRVTSREFIADTNDFDAGIDDDDDDDNN
ncbi:MAG: PH domain-containing protein [Eubacterium sp.]|nr:PH domain-containing protein [Eubacterium sp.]